MALVGSLYRIQMTRMTSLSSQTLTFTVELGAAYRAFLNGGARVGRRQTVWLRQAISLLIIFFSFLALNSTSILLKIKCVFLVCFCINFNHFFIAIFLFISFWSWFCFSILFLSIWFHLIFVSNLVFIILITIF